MSEALNALTLLHPTTIDAAVAALETNPTARLCAGGTDLIVSLRRGLVEAETLIDITGIDAMQMLEVSDAGLRIGAGVTLRALTENPDIAAAYPAISQAAVAVAGPTHREVATVGGNLCLDTRCLYYNQSHWWRKSNDFCQKYRGDICHVAPKGNRCRAAFSGDLAPALMVHGAVVDIAGKDGLRQIPLAELYQEDGADHLKLGPGEIVIAVTVPATHATSSYAKIRVRGAIDFPLAGVAVACDAQGAGARFTLAITGTNSMPLLVDIPDTLGPSSDADTFFKDMSKRVQKAVSPQRTSTTAPHYRRLSVSALACRLARGLV